MIMQSGEKHKPTTSTELYNIVRMGRPDALEAFGELAAFANGGHELSRKLMNSLDAAIARGEVKLPSEKTQTAQTPGFKPKGFFEQLDDLVPQEGLLPPDKL